MSSLTYALDWEAAKPVGSAADATWGTLLVKVGERAVWGDVVGGAPRPIRWTWVELLEALAERWPWLRLEDGWPGRLRVDEPSDFASESRRALEACPEPERDHLAEELYQYRQRHDLSRGLHGVVMPELWIVREGRGVWAGSKSFALRLGFDEVLGRLEALGEEISTRLAGLRDARAHEAVRAWNERNKPPLGAALAIATGLSRVDLSSVVAGGDLADTFEMAAGDLEPTELVAAARMASPVAEPVVLRAILEKMRSLPARPTEALDRLSDEVIGARGSWSADRAYTEGYLLARWLRERLHRKDTDVVDPAILLRGWNVVVRTVVLEAPEIDAVACWGPRHGPAVLLNGRSRLASKVRFRATLAHEVAHLLVDRGDALPLSEVMGGQAPRAAERRANAFAAEFLMPRSVAEEEFAASADPDGSLTRLCRRYRVSREITAWQVLNSDRPPPPKTRRFLLRYVHPRRSGD